MLSLEPEEQPVLGDEFVADGFSESEEDPVGEEVDDDKLVVQDEGGKYRFQSSSGLLTFLSENPVTLCNS